jgi:hypothetical protein
MVFPLSVLVCDAHRAWAFAVVGAFGGKPGGKEPTKKKAR